MQAITDDLELLPKQLRFVASDARELLFSGGLGCGKTLALCVRLAQRACIPGAREGLFRKSLVMLRPTALDMLLHPTSVHGREGLEGDRPVVVDPERQVE